MINSLLSIIPKGDKNYYFSNFGEALIYALIGFLVVVAGIVLIICIIWLLGLILRKTDNLAFLRRFGKRKPKAETDESSVKEESAIPDGELTPEVKVAIIAAIVAYYGNEKPECEFKVRRIKRI